MKPVGMKSAVVPFADPLDRMSMNQSLKQKKAARNADDLSTTRVNYPTF